MTVTCHCCGGSGVSPSFRGRPCPKCDGRRYLLDARDGAAPAGVRLGDAPAGLMGRVRRLLSTSLRRSA